MRAAALLTLTSASLALTANVPLKAPIPGYSVFIPEWEVQATPGGDNVTIKGTVEDVFDELHNINPDYAKAFGINFAEKAGPSARELEKRANFTDRPFICDNFGRAHVDAGWDGIKYLRKVKGKPKASAGPAMCGRVSCSWKTAIWWCNDDDKPKTLESFSDIADGAEKVWSECTDTEFHFWFASGQAFHKDNWNVIVGYEYC
ncbi:hypothetical protein CCHL11_06602 [Colletotrichum chlorophyti]|uniref:Uncharacterized protein n=1 Tax=Colletotrichum chlorophyti TaxID=708187 RepID=A0A1Q8RXZ3_9PEZI|nr:hypothetical protein CCHL11_06602 [Colletotrichum chlorophyti]